MRAPGFMWFLAMSVASATALAQPEAIEPCCGGIGSSAEPLRGNVLRIAADPNNLPFSNDRREGFENKIAELVAGDLGMQIEYEWRAQRRGFFRQTLREGTAHLVPGVPAGFELALPTQPYYSSTYVFVTRQDRRLDIRSFDDPALSDLKIGVQLVGDDGANTPPAHALAARGIIRNVVGFTLYGDYSQENPPARIVDAVAGGDIDVAVVWGPLAGFHAKRQPVPLKLTPVPPTDDRTKLPFAFSIAMGVRKQDRELRDKLNAALSRRRDDIERILDDYGVPRAAVVPSLPVEEDDDEPRNERR
jgi:mxaJ protein